MTSNLASDGLFRYSQVDSTQYQARRLLADPSTSHVRIVLTDYQSHGRGRDGHRWLASPGSSLLVTLVLHLESFGLDCSRWLSFAVANASAYMLEEAANSPLPIGFRWPNDLIYQKLKLGGILIETASTPKTSHPRPITASEGEPDDFIALVGIGINLRSTPSQAELPIEAISFTEVMELAGLSLPDEKLDIVELALWLWEALQAELDRVRQTGIGDLVHRWRQRDKSDGFTYRCQAQGRIITGRACGVGPDGALQLQTTNGTLITTWSASHLPS